MRKTVDAHGVHVGLLWTHVPPHPLPMRDCWVAAVKRAGLHYSHDFSDLEAYLGTTPSGDA